jgi:5'-nucleotidase
VAAFAAAAFVALLGLYANAETPRTHGRPGAPRPHGSVTVRVLGINDLHGHIEPPAPGLGGVAWLAARFDHATLPGRTIRVHAGDLVGASPLASSYFHDEPSIQAARRMRFDIGTLGNHEFDEGVEELRRLLHGGQRAGAHALKRDASGRLVNTSSPEFAGAGFPYISANTIDGRGRLLLPPYRIVERAGVRVGFIGVTTPSAPRFLLPRYSRSLSFTDISDAVNRWVPELRRRGVEAIVVLAHSGAPTPSGDGEAPAGQIVAETRAMSDAVDVVISGHSHTRLDLRIPNRSGRGDKLVVQSLAYGVAFDRVDLRIDRSSGEVLAKRGRVVSTRHAGIRPDPQISELLDGYRRRLEPLGERVLGQSEAALAPAAGLGDLAAAAQRALAKADVALVDPASFRAQLDAGPITYAELFETQAYDEPLLRMRMRGRDILSILDASASSLYSAGLGASPRVLADGRRLDPRSTYTVVANELLATAGPFTALREASRSGTAVGSQVEALAGYVEQLREPIQPVDARDSVPIAGQASRRPLFVCPLLAAAPPPPAA